jgi:TonB family protein
MVRLRACYDAEGKTIDAAVNESSGYVRLDEGALRYGRAIRFRPAAIDGVPQPGCVIVPVQFSRSQSQATQYTGERMTANFQDIDIQAFLGVISKVSGRTIVVDENVKGTLTINLNNVPWDQVLDIALRTKGLQKTVRGKEIVISVAGPAGR